MTLLFGDGEIIGTGEINGNQITYNISVPIENYYESGILNKIE